ncbi:unnamed protein product [Prunus brigantina]
MEVESLQIIIWGHKSIILTSAKGNSAALSLFHSNPTEFDAWWKARFQGLPASSTALILLFDVWNSWAVHAGVKAKNFLVQMIKDINTQVIEVTDPALTKSIGGQAVQAGEVIVTYFIAAGDLELPFRDEEDEILAEQPAAEPETSAESPPPPPTKSKRLRKSAVAEYIATESMVAPTTTSGTDEELREAFEVVEQEKEADASTGIKKKAKMLKKSIALAQKQQETQRAELTSSELALFEDAEAEHSIAVLAEQSVSEPVEQAELPVAAPEPEVEVAAAAEVTRTAGILAVVTSPLKPPVVAMPIHSLPGSSTTASFADPELAEFEAMDLDAQLDKLEKLSSTPGNAKSKVVDEAMERVKIW